MASLQATSGPYAVSQTTVADANTPGFGGATIYYPTDTGEGTFGGVAIAPGFTETQSAIVVARPALRLARLRRDHASTPTSAFDQPASRGTQMLAALDYLTGVQRGADPRRRVPPGRGGPLDGRRRNARGRQGPPALKAAIGADAVGQRQDVAGDARPRRCMIGAQNDSVAPPVPARDPVLQQHAGLAAKKAYLELAGAAH